MTKWLAFALAVAYVPGWMSAAAAPRWILLALTLPVALMGAMRPPLRPAHWLGLAWLAWAGLTVAWSPVKTYALGEFWHLFMLACVFWLAGSLRSLSPALVGAALGMWVNAGVALAQLAWPSWMIQAAPPAGLFLNRNMMGEAAGLTLGACLLYARPWLAAGPALALALSGCRGAWLGVALAGLYVLWLFRPWKAMLCAGLGLLAALAAQQMHLWTLSSISERLGLWHDTIRVLSLTGAGIGSFYTLFPVFNTFTDAWDARPVYPHNEFLGVAFEQGILGLGLFAAFAASIWHCASPACRAILLAFACMAFFEFPLHMPFTGTFIAAVAGWAAACRHRLRGDVLIRGN